MKLVIVESPSKAKTIEKYLGQDYHVIASKGHVVDLPKGSIGVDVENNFKPEYEVINKQSVKLIKDNFKDADELVLAVDPDREGEAIGWHIARLLKLINDSGESKSKTKPLKRIVFTEITKDAVLKAISAPRKIDINLVNAQQARRILDRIVGYKLSPLLWKKIAVGLSAGRVQSAAMRIIVAREELRDKFKSDEYWTVKLFVNEKSSKLKYSEYLDGAEKATNKNIRFDLLKIDGKKAELHSQSECKKIFNEVSVGDLTITKIEEKDSRQYPSPPFTTSTLQQAGANVLGFSASRTMKIAQQLYEAGLITYMRTDSTNLSNEAIEKIRSYVVKKYGQDYVPIKPIYYKSKAPLTQEAHEAIRPSDITRGANELSVSSDQARLYDLIYRRALSCQMSPAQVINKTITIIKGVYQFGVTAPKVVFPGFLMMYKNRLKEMELPNFKEGQKVFADEFVAEQNFTQPPARFTEATLIKELEKNGIGRPSTYAPTISTISVRKYIVKEGKYIVPTSIGKVVDKLLFKNFPDIVDSSFTANMESDLDRIAEGGANWVQVLSNFYTNFAKELLKGEKSIDKKDYINLGKSDKKCPICGKDMFIKAGRFGEYLCCSDFPKCKGILSLNKQGLSAEDVKAKAESDDFKRIYKPAPLTEDGRSYTLKFGRFGYYWAHPDSPKIKSNLPLELNADISDQIYGKPPKSSDGKVMILRRSRFGEFWAHPDYPEKKEIIAIKKSAVSKKKKELGIN